jgi:hypothetical protein
MLVRSAEAEAGSSSPANAQMNLIGTMISCVGAMTLDLLQSFRRGQFLAHV